MGIILQPIPPQDPRSRRAGVQYFETLSGPCDPASWQRCTGLDANGNPIYEPAPYVPDPLACVGGDPLACDAEKQPDPNILQFQDVDILGYNDKLEVVWNDTPVGAGTVPTITRFIYRGWTINHDPTYIGSPKQAAFADATIETDPVLIQDHIYLLLIRPETDTHYGYWEAYFGLTQAGWSTINNLVLHNEEYVSHEGDYVTYTV